MATINRTWEIFEIAPHANHKRAAIFNTPHLPFATDIVREIAQRDEQGHADGEAENISMSIVLDDYRVLSFARGGQPFVYACIAFDRRAAA